jgi:hypothetical protein
MASNFARNIRKVLGAQLQGFFTAGPEISVEALEKTLAIDHRLPFIKLN